MERRALGTELRAIADNGVKRISGYGAIFNSPSEPIGGFGRGTFVEKIAPSAFNDCLAGNPDIRMLWQHDSSAVLGRTLSGTLRVTVDNVGLKYSCDLPSSTFGNDVFTTIARRDVSGSSIGMQVEQDEWPDASNRVLRSVKLFEISAVTWPAYVSTTCAVRSARSGLIETLPLGWYKATGLRLPLTSQAEMRQRVKALQQELRQDDDEDECDCDCSECQGCDGTGCAAGECNCLERQERGRMRTPQGRTIHPIDRWLLQEQRELEEKIFTARQMFKRLR